MDADRWRQRDLQLIYSSNPRQSRIKSHFCIYSCSPGNGALDMRVDPIDREFILGLDARETDIMASNSNSLNSSILLQCNGLVPTCKRPSHSFLESSFRCPTMRKGGKKDPFATAWVRVSPKAERIIIPIGKSCLRASKGIYWRPTAGFESDCNKRHSIFLSIRGSSKSHQFQPIPGNLSQMGNCWE